MTQQNSVGSNSEVCLALDWAAGRGGGLPASGGASHGWVHGARGFLHWVGSWARERLFDSNLWNILYSRLNLDSEL